MIDDWHEFMRVTKALSDEQRVRILLALRGRELCVCQIIELLALAPSTVSKHLSILFQAGLVEARKDGRWMHYAWPGRQAPTAVRQALRWIEQSVKDTAPVREDQNRLTKILRVDPVELCKRQCKN